MTTVDTHTAVKNLIASGFTEKQSEAIIDIHKHTDCFATEEQVNLLEKEQLGIKTDLVVIKQTMATKSDLAELKTELKTEIKEIKTDIKWIMILLVAILGISMKNTFF